MNISSSDVSCDYFELRACLFNLRAKVVNKRIKNRHLRSFQAYYLTVLAYTKTLFSPQCRWLVLDIYLTAFAAQ